MTSISWDKAIEVIDAFAAIDAVRSADGASPIVLKTPEDGLYTLGSRYWLAVANKLAKDFPKLDITLIVDAGEAAGIAQGAIADGHKTVRFTGKDEVFEKLEEVAKEVGAIIVK